MFLSTLRVSACMLAVTCGILRAQGGAIQPDPGAAGRMVMLPFRVEAGGYYHWVNRGYGDWRGLTAGIWLNRNGRFVPGFYLDSQTRPTGTQQVYTAIAYMNWTPSFYTVQSVSGAPERSDQATYFPEMRYDLKGYWKLPPDQRVLLAAGITHFELGTTGRGEIYNFGALYYHNKLVAEGNLFINQNRPGGLWSASARLSIQYGIEGKYWLGMSAGGGRELYRIELATPSDVSLSSYSLDFFYRRWIARHFGYVVGATLQEKLDAYTRSGVSARVFFDF